MKINLQKFIASAGICSRRKAGDLITRGRVRVNGKRAELGMKVDENDKVEVDGFKTPLAPLCERGEQKAPLCEGGGQNAPFCERGEQKAPLCERGELVNRKIYIKLNKPVGYTCTNRKFSGEKNIFDLLEKHPPFGKLRAGPQGGNWDKLFIVGRLDKDSRGLVFLTNDGEMAQRLAHPSFEHEKRYEVRIMNGGELVSGIKYKVLSNEEKDKFKIRNWKFGKQKTEIKNKEIEEIIKCLKSGVEIGESEVESLKVKVESCGEIARAKDVKYLGDNKFLVILTTGKKRQIRRMFASLGYEVEDLLRTGIGKIELGNLKEGEWEEIEM